MKEWTCRLTERRWNGRQSACYEALWKVGGDRALRVTIKRDSYDFQSSAIAELFDAERNQWNRVARVPYPQMSSLLLRAYTDVSTLEAFTVESTFHADERTLLEHVAEVLSVTLSMPRDKLLAGAKA